MQSGLTILMYHRVLPRDQCHAYPLQSLVMPIDAFEEQMACLASRFEVLPVREAIEQLQAGRTGTRPLVSVSFDDGYADNFEYAAPIMEAQGLRGTFFVTTGFIGTGEPLWFDRAASLWECLDASGRANLMARLQDEGLEGPTPSSIADRVHRPCRLEDWMAALKKLTPEHREGYLQEAATLAVSPPDLSLAVAMQPRQLLELHRGGHEVAAHSVTHPILPTLSDDQLRSELVVSRDQVAGWIGDRVVGFCYPNGDLDERVIAAASAAGYHYACATTSGMNLATRDLLRLHRRSITMHRTLRQDGRPHPLGFRGEVSGLREWWR
ncbi:MAG: polysaccharide deacetylase family protein [Gammaproteobacteria bacterium]|nr:polysaccharide deacetylase family protein [Gammaproteobacteria bacterium]